MQKQKLWRVDITHICGYQAPSLYVETSTEGPKAEIEAINLAKEKTRLSEFKEWSIEVVPTRRKQHNGKWLHLYEIEELNRKRRL